MNKVKTNKQMSEHRNHNKLISDAQMKANKRIQETYRKQRKEKLQNSLTLKDNTRSHQLPNDAIKLTKKRLKLMRQQFIENLTSEMNYIIANQPNAMTSLRVKAIYMIGLQNKMIQIIRKSSDHNSKIEKILSDDYK
ncbi:hypothetical protein KSF78_0000182 [Schistosoma japonicum]|nr:hypothetical protein KSF78_0000182 [Schistosoma japonicum]